MYEFLTALFGKTDAGEPEALTATQLVERINADKNLKLVNISDGGYVSEDKFKRKETELKGVQDQLSEANKTIQSFKDMDIDGIKKSAEDWKDKYNKDTADLKKQLADQERAHQVDKFLGAYKFTSKAAEAGVRALFESKDFKLEDGTFLGAKDFMKGLQENDDYKGAFVADDPAPPADPDPNPDPNPKPPKPKWGDTTPTPPKPPKRKSLLDMMREKNENPDAPIEFEE